MIAELNECTKELTLPAGRLDLIVGPTERGGPTTHKVSIAGKVGEIAQGVDADGAWLVSGAISAGPYAAAGYATPGGNLRMTWHGQGPRTKARLAVSRFLERHGVAVGSAGHLHLETITPTGKGLGSSSVDAALAILAAARAHRLVAHPADVYATLCSVERSDPVWLAADLVFARPEAGTFEVWGPQPHFLVLAWDTAPQATVDTQAAACLDQCRRLHRREYADILQMIRSGQSEAIQQAATRSAVLNNRYLPKPGFEWAVGLADQLDAGVICSHSGTYLGLLLRPDVPAELIGRARAEVRAVGFRPEIFLMGCGHE
jgi:L-threonine kinase